MPTNYDQFTKAYASQNRMDHPLRRAVYARWLEACGDVNGIAAVDFGCGAGASSRMLIDTGADYVLGIDNSDEMLQLAKDAAKKFPKGCMTFRHGDIFKPCKPSYSCGEFSLATAVLSMHYAQTRKQLDEFFQNVMYDLSLHGMFVAMLMDPDNPIMEYWPGTMCASRWLDEPRQEGSRIESDLYGADGNRITTVIDYYWTRQTHEELMLEHGLNDIQWIKDGILLQTPLVILKAM